jgi:uncharacterized protein YndB with AHSA1/START domain
MFKWLFGKQQTDVAASGTPEIVVVSRKVNVPRETAFAAFVDRFDTWWPRERRVSGGAIAIEPRIGGKVTEAGTVIGTVLSLQRPEHIVIAWQVGPGGKVEASEATSARIDVRFVAAEPAVTEVVVVHRDFPRHGDGWQGYRAEMGARNGWPALIDAYAKAIA